MNMQNPWLAENEKHRRPKRGQPIVAVDAFSHTLPGGR